MKISRLLLCATLTATAFACSNTQEDEKEAIRLKADSLRMQINNMQHDIDSIKEVDGWNAKDSDMSK